MREFEQWDGFTGRLWKEGIDVRDFIQNNYTPYDGDEKFLEGPTEATDRLWGKLQELQKEERAKGGVLDMETDVVSGITAYGAAYIDDSMKDLEQVVGLQTDKPLKRAFMPYGGIKMAEQSCETYGYKPSEKLHEIFTKYHKTHNQGVFDIYTPEMMKARHNKILTGLPDTYGRGRIVGDYRRVALYGIDYLIERKKADFAATNRQGMRRGDFQLREEIADQVKALQEMKVMAQSYGYDISQPAKNAKEAVQWLYFGYLAAIKTQNGAAMSVGRVSTFLDIYIERDIEKGILTEKEAQELIDHLVMKFRMVKFARIPSYNQLFSGDPVWATLEVAGMGIDGRSIVTKNDFRFLHTLENMGPSPEPNLTVLYSENLPEAFKKYAAHISVQTSSIQYENDDVMRPVWGDDYSICCCVSATETGKEIQFFGARANLAKCLLYAINGGKDEKTKQQVAPEYQPITSEYLDYDEVMKKYDVMMDWLAHLYVGTLNMIHYMHDKYYYEAAEDLKSITIYDNGNLFNQNKAYTLTLEAEYYEALETEITVQGEEKDVPASEPMISKDEDGQTYLVSFGTPTNFVGWKNKVTSITVNGTAYTEAGWFGMSENQFKWETDGYGNQVLKLKVDSEFDENADNTFTIKAEGYKDLALPLVVNVIKKLTPPQAVSCQKTIFSDYYIVSFGYGSEIEQWQNQITGIKVNGTEYSLVTSSFSVGDTTTYCLLKNDGQIYVGTNAVADGENTIEIFAEGYEDCTVTFTK